MAGLARAGSGTLAMGCSLAADRRAARGAASLAPSALAPPVLRAVPAESECAPPAAQRAVPTPASQCRSWARNQTQYRAVATEYSAMIVTKLTV